MIAVSAARHANGERLTMPRRRPRKDAGNEQGLETPARRMISAVPQPAAVARMICARRTCFWARLRSATTASSRSRSPGPSQLRDAAAAAFADIDIAVTTSSLGPACRIDDEAALANYSRRTSVSRQQDDT
jgi:hypothetical protein